MMTVAAVAGLALEEEEVVVVGQVVVQAFLLYQVVQG
jgi:hypothetical protein